MSKLDYLRLRPHTSNLRYTRGSGQLPRRARSGRPHASVADRYRGATRRAAGTRPMSALAQLQPGRTRVIFAAGKLNP